MSSNNTIDKFGRKRLGGRNTGVLKGAPGIGFKLTNDKNYDIQGKCLKNMGEPMDGQDGVTRNYVDEHISVTVQDTKKAVEQSASIIIDSLKNYIAATKTMINQEYKALLNKKSDELTEVLQKYVNDQIAAFKDLNIQYIDEKKSEFHGEYQSVLDKRIDDVTQLLRVYINRRIDEFKSLKV